MNDRNALVDALGRALRTAPDGVDPRWDELAEGELSAEQIDALVDASPLDPAREDALLARALAAPSIVAARPAGEAPRGVVRALRRAWIPLALAASFALVAGMSLLRSPVETPPSFALDAKGDATTLAPGMEEKEAALVVSPGTRVRIALTPAAEVGRELVAHLYLVAGSDVKELAIPAVKGRALRVEGLYEELFTGVAPGRYELVALIAFDGARATGEELAKMAREPARAMPGWRVVRRAIELRGAKQGSLVPVPREVEEATALRAQGLLVEAEARLERAPAGIWRARLAARMALDRGRADEAARGLQEAIARGRAAGDVAGTSKDVLALAYLHNTTLRDPAAASRVLDEAADVLSAWPEGAVHARYTRGVVQRGRGDLRAALAELRAAAKESERAGVEATGDMAREMTSDLLSALGRHAEALAIARSIAPPPGASCRAAEARMNAAWIEIRAARAGAAGDPGRATTLLDEALAMARTSCPARLSQLLTNLAIARLSAGDPAGAIEAAGEAERSEKKPYPGDEVWWSEVRGEAALGDRRFADARRHFEATRAFGERHRLAEAVFQGALGVALTLDGPGEDGVARRALDDAARALDAWARAAPLGEGRGTFLSEQARATRLHAGHLLRRGLDGEALDAVRRGASRYFALLDRGDAELSEPPRIPADTAFFATAALPDGDVGLARLGDRVVRAALPRGPSRDAWLDPFATVLRDAKRLLLPAGGAFREIDVHALPFEGRPIVARMPVAYALDLPPIEAATPSASPVALIVADPSRDLPAVRGTVTPVRAAFEAQGLTVTLLEGDAATREAFRAAVTAPGVRVLHYAGHASFAGQDGLDAALALADGPFSVRDILGLPRVPPHAILLGCSSAGTDRGAESLGLAQAFLVKGSSSAIASRVELDATVVERLGAQLAMGFGAAPDLPLALARAQAALATEGSNNHWAALRALVR